MKKFLSSLLALTMILSLVIVPAQATVTNNDVTGASLSQNSLTLTKGGDTATLSVQGNSPKLSSDNTTAVTFKSAAWTTGNRNVASVNDKGVVTPVGAGETKIYCTATYEYTPTATQDNLNPSAVKVLQDFECSVTVNDAFLASDVKNVTVFGRTYNVADGKATVYTYGDEDLSASGANWGAATASGYDFDKAEYSNSNKVLTVSISNKSLENKSAQITIDSKKNTPTLTVNKNTEVLTGSKIDLVVTNKDKNDTANCKYTWTYQAKDASESKEITTTGKASYQWNLGRLSAGEYTVTCTANYGDAKDVATSSFKLTVLDESIYRIQTTKDTYTLQAGNKLDLKSKVEFVRKQDNGTTSNDLTSTLGIKYKFVSKSRDIATVGETSGEVTGVSDGKATITITATYSANGAVKEYTKDVTVNVNSLSATFEKSVENGDDITYDNDDVLDAAAAAINNVFGKNTVSASSIDSIKIKAADSKEGDVYVGSNKIKTSETLGNDDLTFDAKDGFIGTASIKAEVKTSKSIDGQNNFEVTLKISVTPAGNIKETVTGSSSSSSVSFDVNSVVKYDKLYVYGSKSSSSFTPSKLSNADTTGYNGYWDGSTRAKDGWVLYDDDDTITIPANKFNSGKVTLYVVGLDDDGVASTGTIEVSQKSYAIEYNVVAGETLSFDQKAFESFMNDYADDNIDTNRGDYFELQYVKFDSLPNSTREGVLYEGKDKIKTSTEVENLDKVSFESVAKAKDTIKVPFTLYAKQYDKNDKVIDKKVSMTGEVVISVVKEDIVFEVGVNSAIKLGSDKFIDFLRDSDKSYKKADLDYVTFDVGKNSAITSYFNGTGALYRYYNGSTGINATVSAKDEFYYNPKTSSKHYDLDDVTYVTSKFAKVGDIVYIPFTAYGTKSGQKAEGTLAIKVKQTMNFVDVRPGDYFYDSVQWAVNLDITKGTSATTFSPKQGCTRAQIVTFLWRAANSPAPRSSTNKFTDVYATTHADYMKAIIWATEQGITTGTGNGKFSPDATCTRAQIVTFLYRFKNNPAVYGSLNFSDVNKTEHAAFYNAILWAVNNKITTGYGGGIFDPNGTCNRGDAVTFLYRALA